jgi:hypothetical protein
MILLYAYQRIMAPTKAIRWVYGALSPHLSGSSFAMAITSQLTAYCCDIFRLLG